MPSIFYVGGSVNSLTNTFNIPTSAKSGSVDMGEDHEYRYVNGESLYLQGKADGAAETEFSFNGNATSADVLQNKTFYSNNGTLQTGTIPVLYAGSQNLGVNQSAHFTAGYYRTGWIIGNAIQDRGNLTYNSLQSKDNTVAVDGYVGNVTVKGIDFLNYLSDVTSYIYDGSGSPIEQQSAKRMDLQNISVNSAREGYITVVVLETTRVPNTFRSTTLLDYSINRQPLIATMNFGSKHRIKVFIVYYSAGTTSKTIRIQGDSISGSTVAYAENKAWAIV